MNKHLAIIQIPFILLLNQSAIADSLSTDKQIYSRGEPISAHFTASASYSSAWVGLIPSSIPHSSDDESDKYDLAYKWVDGKSSGTMVFNAPADLGNFDLRMFNSNNNGPETAYTTFSVQVADNVHLSAPTSVNRGSNFRVDYTSGSWLYPDAWIGVLPGSLPDNMRADEADKHDLNYAWIEDINNGDFTLKAPDNLGSFTVRAFDADGGGYQVASVKLNVKLANATVHTNKTHYAQGETINLSFTADSDLYNDAWIALVPSSVPHGSSDTADGHDISYVWVNSRTSGSNEFKAPNNNGLYSVRLFDADNGGYELASYTFAVGTATLPDGANDNSGSDTTPATDSEHIAVLDLSNGGILHIPALNLDSPLGTITYSLDLIFKPSLLDLIFELDLGSVKTIDNSNSPSVASFNESTLLIPHIEVIAPGNTSYYDNVRFLLINSDPIQFRVTGAEPKNQD